MTHRGVIYCATTNNNYLEAAFISAIALRKLEPTLPITVISDRPLLQSFPCTDYGITPRLIVPGEVEGHGAFLSRSIKTTLFHFSPYEETLFLDADILPIRSVQPLWGYLSQGDMAMVSDRNPTVALCDHIAEVEKDYTLQRVPGETMQFNSGVMVWRRTTATQHLFQEWHREWRQFAKHDQLALVRAIATTQVPIVPLPVTYNISPRDAAPVLLQNDEVHLLHCWGGVVSAGKFPEFAQDFYPEVVRVVSERLGVGA